MAYMATDEGQVALRPASRNRMSEYDAQLVTQAAAKDERARLELADLMDRLAAGTALEGVVDIDRAGLPDASEPEKFGRRTDDDWMDLTATIDMLYMM